MSTIIYICTYLNGWPAGNRAEKNMENLITKIKQLANENPDGFTVYLPSLEFVSNGWVIANRSTQNAFGDKGLEDVLVFALSHNRIIGGYKNADGVFQWDAPIVEPNETVAKALMLLHNQDSIYHLNTGRLVWSSDI